MRSQEFENRTIEEAIAAGLNEMNLSLEEVTVDILEEGSKGFLGLIGARMARVRLTEKPSHAQDDYESLINSVKSPIAKANRPAVEKTPVKTEQQNIKEDRNIRAQSPVAPQRTETPRMGTQEKPRERTPFRENQKNMPPQTARPVEPKKPIPQQPRERQPFVQSPEVPAEMGVAGEFIIETAKRMELEVSVTATTRDKTLRLDIVGDEKGILIGHRGETLDALQYLASLVHNKNKEPYERIQLDSQNYRKKREDTLVHLANRLAEKARRTRRRVTLEPMNPYERRILHSALQNNPYVMTHSEGEEPNRRVVILPK